MLFLMPGRKVRRVLTAENMYEKIQEAGVSGSEVNEWKYSQKMLIPESALRI